MAPFTGVGLVLDVLETTNLVAPRALVNSSSTNSTSYPKGFNPGAGTRDPHDINMRGFFALFAIIGAAMVLTALWFFFWAPNGGFKWRKGDWEDYKSTVLRRKGPDGKTLSNATKTTDLGQKSIAGTFDVEKDYMDVKSHGYYDHDRDEKWEYNRGKQQRPNGTKRPPSDDDMRAYRHEKPARVGGLNRDHDGSHFDYSSTDLSSNLSDNSARHLRSKHEVTTKKSPLGRKNAKKQAKKNKQERKVSNPPGGERKERKTQRKTSAPLPESSPHRSSAKPAHGEVSGLPDSYYSAFRVPESPVDANHNLPRRYHSPRRQSQPNLHSPGHSSGNSRQPSPSKPSPLRHSNTSSETGTMVYQHHIPGLSRTPATAGFRRSGQHVRRDSLEDSDGEHGFRRR